MDLYPDLLRFSDGRPVTADDAGRRVAQIRDILAAEEYGFSPPPPPKVSLTTLNREKKCCAGHAVLESERLTFETERGPFSFGFRAFLPTDGKKHPVFLLLNFRPDAYDMYCPSEEIIDNGFALLSVCYADIAADSDDCTSGIACMYDKDKYSWGKIAMWAYGASRIVDALPSFEGIDCGNIAVIGHSRLGKTALWCAAQDKRIRFACSNGSGCAGAAYERLKHKGAEDTEAIVRKFPYWFCEKYASYAGSPQAMPFDQHFLLGCMADRYVSVASAAADLWADPYSEQLSCLAASGLCHLCGKSGFTGPETPAKAGDRFAGGSIAYSLRDGIHFLSRADWLFHMDFVKANCSTED